MINASKVEESLATSEYNTNIYACMHACNAYVCMYTCIYVCMHACIYMYA